MGKKLKKIAKAAATKAVFGPPKVPTYDPAKTYTVVDGEVTEHAEVFCPAPSG